jgi:2,3-bisphosphoglycerate-independent phosphoglycerate mutase
MPVNKLFLIILDGFGLAGREPGNAILRAGTPYLDSLVANYPSFSVAAAGLVVGLPWGQPGNSEVGHSAIGTGRIVIQDLAHINGEIRNGDFFKNQALLGAVDHAKTNDSALHLIGCTSPGGIHAHVDHLIALLELAQKRKISRIFVHFIADGQDMPPQDGINVMKTLRPYLEKAGGRIASVQGRSFAMDRVDNWTLTERVWHASVLGDAPAIADPEQYLRDAYAKGGTDYSVQPATVQSDGKSVGPVQDNDAIIFFDFRNDRVRQLTAPFILGDGFESFDRVRTPKNVKVVTMTKYAEKYTVPVAYPAPELSRTLGQVIADSGWAQWRIAEKEKEAHVTNFFNGGRILPFTGEQRDIVSSRKMKGKEYVEHPEMSAHEIVTSVRSKMNDDAKLLVINFATPDMIAHTGDLPATEQSVTVVDGCLKELMEQILADAGNGVIITADHGNAEELIDPLTGGGDTQHSTRNVPAIFIAPELKGKGDASKNLEMLANEAPIGTLVDVAPSALGMLGAQKPPEMTGSRLI